VTDSATEQNGARRHRLTTFGTLSLAGPDGDIVLGDHGHHRRRLALLAVLAAAGDRGRSRDQLLPLFWPEATQSKARHSLDQLLYALRGSVDESVFAGVNPLRLNLDVIESDVGGLRTALERGDLEAAADTYRGPFLDGFYLSDAPEFERWVESERSRLAASHAGALERLARHADAAGEHDSATRWWSALTDVDPLSSRYAAGRIRALVAAGDHAAALQFAQRYEAAVAEELGTHVDPAIAALVSGVRAGTQPTPIAPIGEPERSLPPADAGEETHDAATVARSEHASGRPSPAGVAPRRPLHRRRNAAYAIAVLLIVSLTAAMFWRTRAGESDAAVASAPSIAVLPLTSLGGGGPNDAALVEGLSEELLTVLAKLGRLRVISHGSAAVFKSGDAAARRMADSLGVSHVLQGSVQHTGSRLRVQVRLVSARDGSTSWAETYDRELRHSFAVQSEIAGAVARELDLRLGAGTLAQIRRGPTRSIAAYELALRGNDPALLRSDTGARRGLEHFLQAVALDSTYAAAWAGVARMQLRVGSSNDTIMSRRARLALAERAAFKAIALDDSLAEGHAALALVRRVNVDMPSARAEMKRAIALDPMNARLHEWMVQLYVVAKKPELALREARRAVELDPLSATATAEVAHALQASNRCDEALAQLARLRSLRPPLLRAASIAAQCYVRKGMWREAVAEARLNLDVSGTRGLSMLGFALARAGRTDEARGVLATLLDRAGQTGGSAIDVAIVYAALGENDEAFAWLDRAVEERSFGLENREDLVASLESDPRYDRFRAMLGIQKR
jgi:TolB-like protein/DNA-binding SARP family transcriptional activator